VDSGAIIENYVFSQLSKEDEFSQKISFWRSQTKNEVYFIRREHINKPCPVEVKTSCSSRQPIPPWRLNESTMHYIFWLRTLTERVQNGAKKRVPNSTV
jgi:hypothetical protein